MRYQGKIKNWKDDQGFGFITPNGGGEKAFVHIKAFAGRARRPVEGDLVTYQLGNDERCRLRAEDIRFVHGRETSAGSQGSIALDSMFAILFCLLLALAALKGRLPFAVLGLYCAASMITFVGYAIDKSAAQQHRWRTQESTLHLFGMLGGWPGALLAQKTLRHKSKKKKFQAVFWGTVMLNCAALGWFAWGGAGRFKLLTLPAIWPA